MRLLNKGPHSAASVHYRIRVLDAGRVVKRVKRKRNLILDQGLDQIATRRWCDVFRYAAAGTGTDPVKRDSGAVTFSRAGNVVTASAGFFEANDVGRLLKWDTGEEAYISAYTSPTSVQTVDSGTIAADEGTVWYVDRTGLAAEVKRTGTFSTDTGDNGMTFSLGAWTMKRTFLFSAESGAVTYNELGWSYTGSAGNNLFGMDIISGGVSLGTGQQLEVVVELTVPVGPAASTPWSNTIAGWSQDGDCCAECVFDNQAFGSVGSSGDSYAGDGNMTYGGLFDPGVNKFCYLSTSDLALVAQTTAALTVADIVVNKVMTPADYVSGTFTRDYSVTFTVAQGNSTELRSIVFSGIGNNVPTNYRAFRVLLDADETKDSDHTLTVTLSLSWGRVLTN